MKILINGHAGHPFQVKLSRNLAARGIRCYICFVTPAALIRIKKWRDDPVSFQAASKAAMNMFTETLQQNKSRWQELLSELTA